LHEIVLSVAAESLVGAQARSLADPCHFELNLANLLANEVNSMQAKLAPQCSSSHAKT